jgi:pimeloyl-ACP methyl ester carboxylesterase
MIFVVADDPHPPTPSADSAPPAADRWRRRGIISLVVLVVLALIAQPVRQRALAAATVADALDLTVPRPFATEVERRTIHLDDIEVDVYGPPPSAGDTSALDAEGSDADVVLLVPGAAPAGREDRRLIPLAEAFARSGRIVVIPELEVYQEDLVPEDIERLVRLISVLAERHGPVVLTGISFGGSLSLIAAGDPRVAGDVAVVATFGAYADLAGVLQAAVTGVAVVDGERYPWDPDPRAEQVVREQIVGLLPPAAGERLEQALDRDDPSDLPEELRLAYEVLTSDDPERVMELVEFLPAPVLDRLEVVSPVRAVPELQVPILAMHAEDDPVIPYGELYRLGSRYPHAKLRSLTTFDHVGIDPDRSPGWWTTVSDLWTTTSFVRELLESQSHSWR